MVQLYELGVVHEGRLDGRQAPAGFSVFGKWNCSDKRGTGNRCTLSRSLEGLISVQVLPLSFDLVLGLPWLKQCGLCPDWSAGKLFW